jgi:hypothetical protein
MRHDHRRLDAFRLNVPRQTFIQLMQYPVGVKEVRETRVNQRNTPAEFGCNIGHRACIDAAHHDE